MNDSLSTAGEKIKIIELLNQFGMAIDLRDWDSFRGLFAESVEFDYSSIGEVASILKPQQIADTARQDLGGFLATQHTITNHRIELSGNTATCKAYVRAMHVLPNEEKESMLEMGGHYNSKLTRINADWKITSWKFDIFWSKGDLRLFELAKKSSR